MEKLYFDYAASTPVDPRVAEAMAPYFGRVYGNPGSLHGYGQEAMRAVDGARESVALALGAGFREVIFTGSATEANNLAIRGIARRAGAPGKIIVSSVEHESVLETARSLEDEGFEVAFLPVDRAGRVSVETLRAKVDRRTLLVSVMYVNNETGAVESVTEIAAAVREARQSFGGRFPVFHTDAVQAFRFLECRPKQMGTDMMTISGHKIYGPKGIGALYLASSLRESGAFSPLIRGGGQEFGLRSGTENVPLIAGFGKAVELADSGREAETEHIQRIRDYFLSGLRSACPGAAVNGAESPAAGPAPGNIPGIVSVYIKEARPGTLVSEFDLLGIAVASGSACSSRSEQPSHVIRAMYGDAERARRSIRFSFGRETTKAHVDRALDALKIVGRKTSVHKKT